MIDRNYFFWEFLIFKTLYFEIWEISVKFKTSVKPVIINVLTMSLVANVKISPVVTHVSAVVVSTVMGSLARTSTNAQLVSLLLSWVFLKSENSGIHQCHYRATCKNTPGAYECECDEGFEYKNGMCRDVNECADFTHSCHQYAQCLNQVGTYFCSCPPGPNWIILLTIWMIIHLESNDGR